LDYKMPHLCPVCNHEMKISKLICTHCPTKIEGVFNTSKFSRLSTEQLIFMETFIKCRGSIKEVEKELGISYPTVRSRLDSVIEALGYRVEKENTDHREESQRKQNILESLERGEISPQEAIRQIKTK
jgi:hypothetical protein